MTTRDARVASRSRRCLVGECMVTTGGFGTQRHTFYPSSGTVVVAGTTMRFYPRTTHRCLDVESRKEVIPLLTGGKNNPKQKAKLIFISTTGSIFLCRLKLLKVKYLKQKSKEQDFVIFW